jgi:predicted permease
MAVRAALGASRLRLAGAAVAESAALSSLGAAAGLVGSFWLADLFPALVPPGALTYVLDVRFDGRVLAFTAVLAGLSTVLVGLTPAWRAVRGDTMASLKVEAVASGRDRRGWPLRDLIVVAQVAVCVVVLVAAGLLVRSLAHGLRVNPGFDTGKSVATFYLVPGLSGYDAERTYRFFEQCRAGVRALPGVRRASYAIRLPAQGNEVGWAYDFTIPGKEPPPGERFFRIKYTMVGPDYFEVVGTRIRRGRGIQTADLPGSVPVAVINETMARSLWPGEDPIGKKVLMGRDDPVAREIVGVAEDNKIGSLYEPTQMYLYVPYAQHQQQYGLLLVEVDGKPEGVFDAVKRRIAEVDPAQPVLDVGSFDRHMRFVLFEERRDAWIAVGIALLAVALGAVGIHGVVSLVSALRTREMGIRLALGARPSDVRRLVLSKGLRLAAAGLVVGSFGGLVAGKVLESRLHGVSGADPWSFLLGAMSLLAVAALASLIPARRAGRLDPVVALRYE